VGAVSDPAETTYMANRAIEDAAVAHVLDLTGQVDVLAVSPACPRAADCCWCGARVGAKGHRSPLPYALTVASELCRLADGCLLITRARRLVDWVGEGKPVTTKGVLRPVDVPVVGNVLGVTVPARVRTAADVEAVHWPWVAAEAIGLLRVSANRAVAVAAVDEDPVRWWWTAVRAVLRAESHDDRGRGAPVLLRTLLTVMTAQSPPEMADISEAVHELLHYSDIGDSSAVYSAFRRGVMPVDAGLELLAEVGAMDGAGRLTELGRWMWQRLVEEWPPPLSSDAPAAAVLERLAAVPGDEVWQQAGPWLAERGAGRAATELFDAAAEAPPAQRIAAVELVAGLGESALSAWQQAAKVPTLAPHAGSFSPTSKMMATTTSRRSPTRAICDGSQWNTRRRRWLSTDPKRPSLSFASATASRRA
jgi:hypothetical protein